MAEDSTVLYEQHGRVARIILNRPQYRNAQSNRLIAELDAAFDRATDDPSVGVIVLAAAGDHFSAGHDLGSPEHAADVRANPSPSGIRGKYDRQWRRDIESGLRWRDLPKPTIAEVRGYAIYAGVAVAESCDLIFASDDAMFLMSNYQYFAVPWDLGVRKAKEILFESRFVGAQEACELGLANRVIPRERLEEETMAYAARVAENDPFQLRMMKFAINQAQDAQGFTNQVRSSLSNHLVSRAAEEDEAYLLDKPQASGVRRRPMVQRALENYERDLERRSAGA
ncbi:MAG: enoyl-CoA hydratase-related protein [Dehalococcoidia bacterium]|nr:enoyl-CoA hydratase-related protein [Dehalococcoidia bacterium]